MKVEYSDASCLSTHPFAEESIVDDTEELIRAEHIPNLTESTMTCNYVADYVYESRQRPLHGYLSAETLHSRRLQPRSMGHPEGHCDQFPAPPKAWECCGCKQKFYNFEKQCSFCATLYCKDCKKIPWK